MTISIGDGPIGGFNAKFAGGEMGQIQNNSFHVLTFFALR